MDRKNQEQLDRIEGMLNKQSIMQKEILNFNETCSYLDVSASHLYKLTSSRQIPHFCPQGKRLYFNRLELDNWLQRNRKSTSDEIDQAATDYLTKHKMR